MGSFKALSSLVKHISEEQEASGSIFPFQLHRAWAYIKISHLTDQIDAQERSSSGPARKAPT